MTTFVRIICPKLSGICVLFVQNYVPSADRTYFQKSGSLSVAEAVKKGKVESDVAERLRNAGEEKGWSQHELGKRIQVASSIINRVEFEAKLTQKQGVKHAKALEPAAPKMID